MASSKVQAGEGLPGSAAKADGFYAQETSPKIQVRKPAHTEAAIDDQERIISINRESKTMLKTVWTESPETKGLFHNCNRKRWENSRENLQGPS